MNGANWETLGTAHQPRRPQGYGELPPSHPHPQYAHTAPVQEVTQLLKAKPQANVFGTTPTPYMNMPRT